MPRPPFVPLLLMMMGTLAAGEAPALAQPSPDELKTATTLVRTIYGQRYARADGPGKAALARLLLRHAPMHAREAALEAALLRESMRLAVAGGDYRTLLAAIDRLATVFSDVVPADERRQALAKAGHQPQVVALARLLDDPDDGPSRAIAGRWLALEAGRWEEGLPLLATSADDPALRALAAIEVDPSVTPAALVQAAQGWDDLAAKRHPPGEGLAMLTHAHALYARAIPALVGDERDRAEHARAALAERMPMDLAQVDWRALTAEQWDRIPAPVIAVSARVDHVDTPFTLAPGQAVRVIPRPGDTWSFDIAGKATPVVSDWRGKECSVSIRSRTSGASGNEPSTIHTLGLQGHPLGTLIMWTDPNHRRRAGVFTGQGRLKVGVASDRVGENGAEGAIRVKIVPVEPE